MRTWTILIATAGAVALCAAAAAADEAVRVTASSLNVRSGPSTGYSIIGGIPGGQIYVSIARSGDWHKIWYSGSTGWVHGGYVTGSSTPIGRVTASSLNVRTGPGTGYSIVGGAPSGSVWAIVGASGDWRKICFAGAVRYVHGGYLTGTGVSTPASSSSAPPPSSSAPASVPGGRSSAGFINLPSSGPGFYAYQPSYRRWGTPSMIYGLVGAARSWSGHRWPRIGIGDISLAGGGYFSPHASHRYGKDADVRPVASTTYEGPLTRFSSSYSRSRTYDWITNHVVASLRVNIIFYNDPSIDGALGYVKYWSGHDNHMHIRIY